MSPLGTCKSLCVTGTDCIPGDVCRSDRAQCLPKGWTDKANPDQSDEGACAHGRASASLFGFAVIALALSAMRRRRD